MPGRNPISIAQKRANGDTRKLGANKFQESLGAAWEPRRGRPKFPAGLLFRAIAGEDAAVAAQRKSRLAMARAHWKYIADHLEAEKKLALLDEGVLTGLAMLYALFVEAGREGRGKEAKELFAEYRQGSDRMGLNESARARIPGPERGSGIDPLMEQIGPRRKTA